MEISAGFGLLSVFVLVLANGFFVATEFAIVAVRRSRLEQLVQEKRLGAAAAKDVVSHLDAYIAACQLGITMASLGLGWMGEPAVARILEGPLKLLFGTESAVTAHGVTVGLAFALITALHIVIGELAPKGVALQRPEATTLWVAHPVRLFYRLFKWPIGALNAVGNGVLRLSGLQASTGHEMVHTAEELRLLVHASHEAGAVEESEARIAARAFQFADLNAGELMTPRMTVAAVSVEQSLDEVIKVAGAAGHSCLPVYKETLDDVVGVLRVPSLLAVARNPPKDFDLRSIAKPVAFIPVTRGADHALEDMRGGGYDFAIVVDEYGVTVGILTFHDIMQALVGRIAQKTGAIGARLADGSIVVDGLVRLAEFEEVIGAKLPPQEREDADTLNGLLMIRLGRVPVVGDVVDFGTWRVQVDSVDHNRVDRARLLPTPPAVR